MLKNRHIASLLAVGILSVVSAGAYAQDGCTIDDTILECWHRFNPDPFGSINTAEFNRLQEEKRGQTKKQVTNALLELVTSSSVVGADTAATVSNFLPLLSVTGFGGDLTGDSGSSTSSDEDLAIDLNFPFFGSDGENAIKLQAVFSRDREVFAPLLDAIPEAERDQFRNDFNDQSNIGDDVRVSVSYSLTNKTFGRTLAPHRTRLDQLYDAATSGVGTGINTAAIFAEIESEIKSVNGSIPRPGPADAIANWPNAAAVSELSADDAAKLPGLRSRIISLVEQAARATANLNASLDAALATSRVLDFRSLIDNQPQLVFSASIRERDELIGPDETRASVIFEYPLGGNLWGFARSDESSGCGDDWNSTGCLDEFREYLDNQSRIAEMAPRLSISIDYTEIDDYSISLSDPMVSFSQAGSRKLIGTLGFGMRFNGEGVTSDSRFDLALKYEDLSDDPARNSRTVASATWTKQFRGLSIPVSLVYSNKPEFLDQQSLGERLSAHIGLKYEFRQLEE